jgi:hypothetical protein
MLTWLESCLAADESIANEVSGRYEDEPGPGIWVHDDDYRHDSLMVTRRSVLADIAAKRASLRYAVDVLRDMRLVQIMAGGYRHRPGFSEEWATDAE